MLRTSVFSGTYATNLALPVILVVCALLSGFIASRSGRRFLPWFLGGLFFGPLTLLYVLIVIARS